MNTPIYISFLVVDGFNIPGILNPKVSDVVKALKPDTVIVTIGDAIE